MGKVCVICHENLLTKYSSYAAMVPLFCETTNKEFSGTLNGKPVILAKLLGAIGIVVGRDHERLVWKKCARKIVNCFKLFSELQQVFTTVSVGEKPQEVSTASLPSDEGDKHRILEHHHRSPTGITPTAKRQKLISYRGYSVFLLAVFWLTQADWQQALHRFSLCQFYRTSIAKTLLEWSWYTRLFPYPVGRIPRTSFLSPRRLDNAEFLILFKRNP